MKKAIIFAMLGVFMISFVGTILATNVHAKPCPKPPPCIVQLFPDGSRYVCCFEYVKIKGVCTLVELPCYWIYPPL